MMITVKLDAFEGPLDLLLHLIEKAEVDIYDISVAEITTQYVQYIYQMQQLELEIASEFLVMAATLIALKSKMLLPKKEEEISFQPMLDIELEEIDSRDELIHRLLEYKKFKQLAGQLREKEAERSLIFTRPAENLSVFLEQDEPNPVENISLFHLMDVFQNVLVKKRADPVTKVDRDEVSIEKRIGEITQILSQHKKLLFTQLFEHVRTREQIVVTFLAILELMKKKEVICQQEALFADIWIFQHTGEKDDGF